MIEREFKLAAAGGIVLPDLTDSAPGVTVRQKETVQLEAVYYDTQTLALARWGVTLRSRSGEPGPVWTLKLPVSSADSALSRHEIMFDEPVGPVPATVRRAVKAYTRSHTLGPVVRLQTERTQFVVELDGQPLAHLCDDTVVADGAAEPVTVFREIEVELVDAERDAAAVSAILARLRTAGCKDDEAPVPKAIRALGPRAFDPPDVVIREGRQACDGRWTCPSIACHVGVTAHRSTRQGVRGRRSRRSAPVPGRHSATPLRSPNLRAIARSSSDEVAPRRARMAGPRGRDRTRRRRARSAIAFAAGPPTRSRCQAGRHPPEAPRGHDGRGVWTCPRDLER